MLFYSRKELLVQRLNAKNVIFELDFFQSITIEYLNFITIVEL